MKLRFCALLLSVVLPATASHASGDSPVFIVKNEIIPSPAAPDAVAPSLVNAPDGTVCLSWLEPAPDHHTALRFARFDAASHAWNSLLTISNTLDKSASPRSVVTTQGQIQTTWTGTDHRYPPPTNSRTALVALADGTCLSTILGHSNSGTTLIASTLGRRIVPEGSSALLVDTSVDPDSTPALAAFPDGSALVVYVKRAPDGARSLFTARFADGRWHPPVALGADSWSPKPGDDCNPAIAVRGIHLAVAWFSTNGGPRVNVSTSDNAGVQWLAPNRVDDVAPIGRIGLVLLDDGSLLVSWVERVQNEPVVLLRRISPRGTLGVPVMLARTVDGSSPQLARVKDGDATPAQLLLVYAQPAPARGSDHSTLDPQPSTLTTRLITLPDAASLAEADPCDCDPKPGDLRSYAIKGTVVSVDGARGTLQLSHGAIPGVMKAATTTLKAAPEVLGNLKPGQTLLARIERTGSDWSLFNVRLLGTVSR